MQHKLRNNMKQKEKIEKGVVYEIPCNSCEKTYVGETGRGTSTSNKEHIRDLKTGKVSSAPYQHWITEGRDLNFTSTKVIYNEDRKTARRELEGLAIANRADKCINLVEGRKLSRMWGVENISRLTAHVVK